MEKITPFIWFVDKAEEAAKFYVGLFPDAKITNTVRYPKAAEAVTKKPAGSVMTVALNLAGQKFTFINGGEVENMKLDSGAISFVINCETQAEIDKYWAAFSDGGKPIQCGWIIDKYGVTWQVVPTILPKLLSDPDQAKVERVTACYLKMVKFDIAELQKAAAGK